MRSVGWLGFFYLFPSSFASFFSLHLVLKVLYYREVYSQATRGMAFSEKHHLCILSRNHNQ